jgi:hypothetical protein
MPPIPKSITVTVRNGENFKATRPGRTYPGLGFDLKRVRLSFPKTPDPPYRVTYTLCKNGKYKFDGGQLYIGNSEDSHWADPEGTFIFFLPESWWGLRVSRRVEKVK